MLIYDQYVYIIQNPDVCFPTNKYLQDFKPVTSNDGTPMYVSGGLGIVFKLQHKSNKNDIIALKCFVRIPPDQKKRYKKISEYINNNRLPYFVQFKYFEEKDGIVVNKVSYPVLMMQFVEGELLSTYLNNNLYNSNKLKEISEKFLKMLSDLKKINIAHGDFQEGNIMVSGNDLKLVDYDGMYVPPLQGEKSIEYGLPNYQHPKRFSGEDFGPYLDNFSGWVIYLSIVALIYKPSLWTQFKAGNKQLLFTQYDFLNPDRSAVIKELEKINDSEFNFNKLLQRFKEILKYQSLSQIPSIVDYTSGIAISSKPQVPVIPKPPPIPPYPTIPIPGSISINTNPAGAEIYISGDFKGYSPLTLNLKPGVYSLRIIKNGYEDNISTFKISGGETKRFNIFLDPKSSLTPLPPRNLKPQNFIRPFITFVFILSILILPFYLPKIYNFIKNKWTFSSPPSSTTTVSTVLDKVQLLSPMNGSTLPSGSLTLSWDLVNNATKYEILIHNESGNTILDKITSSSTFTITLNSEGEYKWSVRAGDDSGKWGAWSTEWSFKVLNIKTIYKFKINTNPQNADVWIDDIYYGKTPLEIDISEKEHNIKIKRDGYEDYISSFYPKTGEALNINLNSLFIDCPIKTIGLSRDLYNENKDRYKNEVKELQRILSNIPNIGWQENYNITGEFGYGTEGLLRRFQKAYNLNNTGIIDEETKNKLCEIWNMLKINVTINSEPSGAEVYLDDIFYGVTPLQIYLTPSYYTINLKKYGYKDIQLPITVSEEYFNFNYKLQEQIKFGYLSIDSNPTGATIFIDDNLIKETTPLYKYSLESGFHTITISKFGYLDYKLNIQIIENQVNDLGIINLEPVKTPEETFTFFTYNIPQAENKIIFQIDKNNIIVDDKIYDINTGPEIKNNKTFLPLIAFSEAYGIKLTWISDLKVIKLDKENISIELQIGVDFAKINGETIYLDEPLYVKSNEIMVPLRFIAENFNLRVDFDSLSKTYTIYIKP